jgi:hypothetical protein
MKYLTLLYGQYFSHNKFIKKYLNVFLFKIEIPLFFGLFLKKRKKKSNEKIKFYKQSINKCRKIQNLELLKIEICQRKKNNWRI